MEQENGSSAPEIQGKLNLMTEIAHKNLEKKVIGQLDTSEDPKIILLDLIRELFFQSCYNRNPSEVI
ncbi:hypothetical protein AYI70_g5441 [Smittium culicis]|uniref:Uncharacterized protein n=1 Tax=Smittium culicis TaxID=133412 RepID=A0A1R1X3F6_9FUNG|nr:hypothetical protein AYI70_g11093 [Smittium culicis]OMJ18279.1 hypothetical protein AYI70_g5441 [Smittium culicis]